MNKNESKYFNTAVKMDNALIKILEKKDFEYITIKEICDTAGVNRSTFYLHYSNTVDLLQETTKYITDKFLTYFTADVRNSVNRIQTCDTKELIFITPEYITPYLTFIKENQHIFKTSMKHIGSMGFGNVYNDLFTHILSPVLGRFNFSEKDKKFVLKFYLTGITAIAMEWLQNGCKESIEDICRIIIDCVVGKMRINEKDKYI